MPPNLIKNPSFEDSPDIPHWTSFGFPVFRIDNHYPLPVDPVNEPFQGPPHGSACDGDHWVGAAHSGERKLVRSELFQEIMVRIGSPYFASAWVYTHSSPNPITASLIVTPSDREFVAKHETCRGPVQNRHFIRHCDNNECFQDGNRGWKQLSGIVVPETETIHFSLVLEFDAAIGGAGGNFDLAEFYESP